MAEEKDKNLPENATECHKMTRKQSLVLQLLLTTGLNNQEIADELTKNGTSTSRETVSRLANRADIKEMLKQKEKSTLDMILSMQPFLIATQAKVYEEALENDPRLATQIAQFFLKNVLESKINISGKLTNEIVKKTNEMTKEELLEYWKTINEGKQ